MDNFDKIKQNLQEVKNIIRDSCEKASRSVDDVTLLAVTKTIDNIRIQNIIDLGIKDLAENKVQEFLQKYEVFGDCVNWHFIGHLQTNKVKYIIDKVSLIHSVDSIKLAEEINKRSMDIDRVTKVLVQINISNEDSKFGININDLDDFLERMSKFEYLDIQGIMTVASFVANSEQNRAVFKEMYKKFIDIMHKNKDNINIRFLSMGMSNDYGIAIEEGANMVRIGTGIFGKRS